MNWEAFFVVGSVVLVLGVVLFVPARLWAKRTLAQEPASSNIRTRITKVGFVFYGFFLALVLVLLSLGHIAPSTQLGQFVSGPGRFVVILVVIVLGVVAEIVVQSMGVTLYEQPNAKDV